MTISNPANPAVSTCASAGPTGHGPTSLPTRIHPRAGTLEAIHNATEPGPYLAEATTRAAEGKPALTAQAGWVVNALRDEYLAIRPDMAAMERLAATTGGRVINACRTR